ncbi:MAG TPA: hypothetical protein DCF65_11845 [Chloroflexi bacterium]|nr:hypothetical protein [Chloroflexota bacterium]HAF18529.1 hypothetical protein [Chloroflexota bacterium]
MQASRLLASQLNSVNFRLHEVAGSMEPDDWLRRAVPGTNLPAFTFWHVVRVIDSTVHTGIRGVPELIESPPWASKAWARSEGGVGYSVEEADELAAQVVPAEILEYADVLRSHISQWLRAISDEELEAPNAMSDNVNKHNAYNRPAVQESLKPLVGQPVWLLLSITCYAHCWAHLEEIRLLTAAGRTARQ